jgi:ubiquinone/menaquinone biosynthesis C-methylase UbiE
MSDSKRVIRDRFGSSAANYTASQIHAQGEDLGWLIDAHALRGDEWVLDVGTGTGNAAFAFSSYVGMVEGIDITPAMLAQAEMTAEERKLTNVHFSVGDVEDIPRDDNTYDIVVSRWCAHHYGNIRLAVSEIARVLKPGGVFLLIDSIVPHNARLDTFVNTLEMLRDNGHVRNYSIHEWLEFTEIVGMHGEVLYEWLLRLDGDSWVERIKTPPVHIATIKALLADADSETRAAINITDESHPAGWGFDLPSMLMKATLL